MTMRSAHWSTHSSFPRVQGKSTDILNRDQTEEWKGWMQFMFLLYHYYHAEEVYNAIRIMITCYVWMTGFGNFSFFYIKQVGAVLASIKSSRQAVSIWRVRPTAMMDAS